MKNFDEEVRRLAETYNPHKATSANFTRSVAFAEVVADITHAPNIEGVRVVLDELGISSLVDYEALAAVSADARGKIAERLTRMYGSQILDSPGVAKLRKQFQIKTQEFARKAIANGTATDADVKLQAGELAKTYGGTKR